MEANPPELKRDGTMQVTAQEGVEFLKRSGAEDLIPVVDGEGDAKPEIKRDTTMEATLKEGEAFLEAAGKPAEEVRTRGEQEGLDAALGDVPAIPRDNTMQVTAKEGQELLGGEELGSTRAETEALKDAEADGEVDEDDDEVDEDDDEDDEDEENGDEGNGDEGNGDEDRANLKRTITDPVTEGEECLKRQKTNGEATEESAPAEAEAAS